MLATAEAPTAGSVRWFGITDRRSRAVRRRLGVVFDRPLHFEGLSGWQNAEFFAGQYGVERHLLRRRLDYLFEWAGIAAARDLPVGEYSLGMRRRLSLVEAFCHEPDLLLLDEPSLALDHEGELDLSRLLLRLARQGSAIFIATNDLALADAVCSRRLSLAEGQLREVA
jgi:ABC-type multidrug transport system ATPase subunit